MKIFEWLPMSEENSQGRRDGHYLFLNYRNFQLGETEVLIGGTVFSTLYPFRALRNSVFARKYSYEYCLSLWLIQLYLPFVRDAKEFLQDDDDDGCWERYDDDEWDDDQWDTEGDGVIFYGEG